MKLRITKYKLGSLAGVLLSTPIIATNNFNPIRSHPNTNAFKIYIFTHLLFTFATFVIISAT
jgi:hypothetical protein